MKRTLREYSPQDEAKITIIPHGIRRCCALESPKRNCQARILSLGFIRERKGIEDLITAFKQVLRLFPGAKLIIVGGQHAHDKGEYRRNIQKLVEPNLDKSVFFTGFVDERLLERLVHKSDIIVLISKDVYVESSGALATVADCGKPIICSRIPKFQGDLKTGYDCIMVSPSNSTELSQAIVSLLKDQRFMEILRKNLAKHSESRNWETVAEQHVKLYAAVSRIE
jgi:glycosyltransferase involved in cell wall biosynthesis